MRPASDFIYIQLSNSREEGADELVEISACQLHKHIL